MYHLNKIFIKYVHVFIFQSYSFLIDFVWFLFLFFPFVFLYGVLLWVCVFGFRWIRFRLGMLGTSEERPARYMGPAGSQTQHQNSHPHSNSQQATAVPYLAPHPSTPFPSYFSPYSHFQHLAALHTSFGGSNLNTPDLIFNQTSALTSSLWPGSPTLSSTTNGQLPHTPSSAASSGRLSAFDFYTNGQGEFLSTFFF